MFYMIFILQAAAISVNVGTPRLLAAIVAALVSLPALVAIWRQGRNADKISDWYVVPTALSMLVGLALLIEGGLN